MNRINLALTAAIVSVITTRAFMSDTCETVNVVGADGQSLIINKSDYDNDPTAYKLYKGDDVPIAPPIGQPITPPPGVIVPPAPSAPDFINAVAPASPSVGQLLILAEGDGAKKRFFICDVTGTKVKDKPGIENDGYKTEDAAKDVIKALAGTVNSLP